MISCYSFAKCFLIIFIFLIVIIDFSVSYKTLTVEDSDLCSAIKKRKIKLGTGSKSGLIIKQRRLGDHLLEWEKNFSCKFQVDASPNSDGIFAVIQNIVFRKNESTNECIDYIQFKRHDGSTSKKYCGRVNAPVSMDHNFAPYAFATSLTPTSNSFVEPTGVLDVHIFVAKEALRPEEETDLTIVFTSYRYCFHAADIDKPCGDNFKNSCIFQYFFKDGFVNCPYADCLDEGGCDDKIGPMEKKQSVGNTVIISSVSSLLVIFIIFVCCVWICRRYHKFCWADDFSNPITSAQQSNTTRTIELSDQSSSRQAEPRSGNNIETTAPAREQDDKDLPPSYESLFPDR